MTDERQAGLRECPVCEHPVHVTPCPVAPPPPPPHCPCLFRGRDATDERQAGLRDGLLKIAEELEAVADRYVSDPIIAASLRVDAGWVRRGAAALAAQVPACLNCNGAGWTVIDGSRRPCRWDHDHCGDPTPHEPHDDEGTAAGRYATHTCPGSPERRAVAQVPDQEGDHALRVWLDSAIGLADRHGVDEATVHVHMLRLVRERLAAQVTAQEERLRAARFVATHWRDAVMASDVLRPTGMSHPLALVLAALDGETSPLHLGIGEDQHDAFRRALGAESKHDEPELCGAPLADGRACTSYVGHEGAHL